MNESYEQFQERKLRSYEVASDLSAALVDFLVTYHDLFGPSTTKDLNRALGQLFAWSGRKDV